MPNTYGANILNQRLCDEDPDLYTAVARWRCMEVEDLGASFICMACDFWYELNLASGEAAFGIDMKQRTVTLSDDGTARMNVSTLQQCDGAVDALWSSPESGALPALVDWKNKPLYINSFKVSRWEMLDTSLSKTSRVLHCLSQ
jgi:hypothetical protein